MQLRLLIRTVSSITLALVASTSSQYIQAQTTGGNAPWVGDTLWGTACKSRPQGFGPYDYLQRHQEADNLDIVERVHFTPNIEQLISGNSGSLYDELQYTLNSWPNHHRALNSVIRLRLRDGEKSQTLDVNYPPAECYLQRAINFSPNDGIAYMLYGILLHRMDQLDEALAAYQHAESLEPTNLQITYNMGLLLIDLERYDDAVKYGKKVYANEYPFPGLQRKLKQKGYWDDSSP